MAMENLTSLIELTSSSKVKKMMHELFDRNTIVLIGYVALVCFRHSKQTEIVMVHKKKKTFFNDSGKYEILHVTFLRFCSDKNVLLLCLIFFVMATLSYP